MPSCTLHVLTVASLSSPSSFTRTISKLRALALNAARVTNTCIEVKISTHSTPIKRKNFTSFVNALRNPAGRIHDKQHGVLVRIIESLEWIEHDELTDTP
jgi:hypothetical protein